MHPWLQVQKDLGVRPITEGDITGAVSLHVERYLFRSPERPVAAMNVMGIITLFGGSRVQERDDRHARSDVLPSQSMMIPAHCPTRWRYSGTVDFAAFYFPSETHGIQDRLRLLTESKKKKEPLLFGDALVSATALQLVNELHKGSRADEQFMAMLALVMLEQTYRVLTTPEAGAINPRHSQFDRLQAVLRYVREHLAEDLSAQVLAEQAHVSLAHFRRLFQDAMGSPPHRYILAARLEQARTLLTMTTHPISRIAEDCGFASQSHLTARFRSAHAATPAEFRAHVRRSKAMSGKALDR